MMVPFSMAAMAGFVACAYTCARVSKRQESMFQCWQDGMAFWHSWKLAKERWKLCIHTPRIPGAEQV